MTKTVSQIRNKANALIREYREEVNDYGLEGAGDEYLHRLNKYIGDFWDYEFQDRRQIQAVIDDLKRAISNP